MAVALVLCFLVFATATSHAVADYDPNYIRLLRPKTGASGQPVNGLHCPSWRLAVETNNERNWKVVPATCAKYVCNYMLCDGYYNDCEMVADVAIEYAKNLTVPKDGKSIWVFDIDETALSNLPYFVGPKVDCGAKELNKTEFGEYMELADDPAIPATLRLYKKLLALGIKVVFLTGTPEPYREARKLNLKIAGYRTWEKLILRPLPELNESALYFKSKERTKLVEEGYRIVGNIGDQWSDITGNNTGLRTFKLPNPMYYVA